jgi:hypothetical protein
MMDMNEDSLDAPPSVGSLESSSPAPNKKKGRTPLSDNILQLAFLFSSFLAQNAHKNLYW